MSKNYYVIVKTTKIRSNNGEYHMAAYEYPKIINTAGLSYKLLDTSDIATFMVTNKRKACVKARRLNRMYPEFTYTVYNMQKVEA